MSWPITWGDVTAIAPEAAAAAAGTQAAILAQVGAEVDTDEDTWGATLAPIGAAYLAAHLYTLSKSKGKGPVTSESEGALSRSYADLTKLGALGLSIYGIEYLRLTRTLQTTIGAVF